MGVLVGSKIFIRYKMKLIALAFLIPFVYGDCPPPPNEPIECTGSDLICAGVEDSNGCMMPNWCLSVDPYAPCSAKATCPTMCHEGTMRCSGGKDSDGCPMPDTCEPETKDACGHPTMCPVHCDADAEMCPGEVDPQGCKMPDSCWPKDPNCPFHCPMHCGEGSMQCSGGTDGQGCPMPDTCINIDPKCPTNCPMNCGPNEMYCPKGIDVRCRDTANGTIPQQSVKLLALQCAWTVNGPAQRKRMTEVVKSPLLAPSRVNAPNFNDSNNKPLNWEKIIRTTSFED